TEIRGEGQARLDAHKPCAQPPETERSGGGQTWRDAQTCSAPSAAPRKAAPTAVERSAAVSARNSVAVSFLDSVKLRDGRRIGDVRFNELERMRSANVREAALIKLVQ